MDSQKQVGNPAPPNNVDNYCKNMPNSDDSEQLEEGDASMCLKGGQSEVEKGGGKISRYRFFCDRS